MDSKVCSEVEIQLVVDKLLVWKHRSNFLHLERPIITHSWPISNKRIRTESQIQTHLIKIGGKNLN